MINGETFKNDGHLFREPKVSKETALGKTHFGGTASEAGHENLSHAISVGWHQTEALG